MSFVFDAPAPIVDVGILLLQSFVGGCWLVVIYRVVSLGGQLDILPLPSSFPHYASFSSATTTKQYWLSLGWEILFTISLLEVIFSIYCLYLVRCAQAEPNPEQRSWELMKDLIIRVLGSGLDPVWPSSPQAAMSHEKHVDPEAGALPSRDFLINPLPFDHPKAKDFRENHRVWFQNCHWDDIYRQNHMDWLCAVLYNKTLEQVKEEDRLKSKDDAIQNGLEELIVALEKRVGTKVPEGYNESLRDKMIRLTKDPVKVAMRPLTLSYGFAWATNELIRQIMKWSGFEEKQCLNRKNGLKYLIRIPQSWRKLPIEQRPPPIIFIHGVGLGFLLYIALIKYLTFSDWSKGRPVMVLIQPHISMQIFSPAYFDPPSQTQLGADMKEVFEELGFNQTGVELLAHSNGTVVAGWIIKTFPQLIRRCCLLDPICFALWEGHTCYNFLYSKPKTGLEKLMRFSMGEELGIAWYTRRHFDWPDAVLWPYQIPGFRNPKRFMVVLCGKDSIVNASRTRDYLRDVGMVDASPMQKTSDVCQLQMPDSSGECQGSIQMEFDQPRSSSVRGGLGAQLSKEHGAKTEEGGILFDPRAAHGQTLVLGHPYLKKIQNWLEGDDAQMND